MDLGSTCNMSNLGLQFISLPLPLPSHYHFCISSETTFGFSMIMPFIKLACKVYDKTEDCIFYFLYGHEVMHLKLSVIAL